MIRTNGITSSLLILACLLASLFLPFQGLRAASPSLSEVCSDYSLTPPFLTGSAPPMVMLVMGRNHKLFYEAYNDASDIDGDGQLDVGYKPSIDYYGYFDSHKCYRYTSNRFEPSSVTADKTCSGSDEWSGDFLNYLTMSRMDSLRKVLYGGKRSTDSSSETVLERAYIPQDAHSWGKEYTSTTEDGYDIREYTPLDIPSSGTRHLFASTTLSEQGDPVLRYVTDTSARVWEWVSKERPVAGTSLSTGGSVSPTDRNVRVKVCDPSMPEDNCKEYPDGNLKPVGILQRYGESGRIKFGLISGSYEKNTSGGVLRKNVSSIANEVVNATGEFDTSVNGIIQSIDKFSIYGFDYGDHTYDNEDGGDAWVTTRPMQEGEFPNWGNPIAEMMYEGLRYFSGAGSALSDFDVNSGIDDSLGLPSPTWSDPYDSNAYCAKPIMLVISDIYPNYDTDQLPGSAFDSNWSSGESLGNSTLHVSDLADVISSQEGLSGKHFIGETGSVAADSSCKAKETNDFGQLRGLCPEEPTKLGGYYSGSVAYFGKKTDIHASTEGVQSVDTYAVALSSPLPEIEIPVGDKVITLVPFAKSVGGSGYGIDPSRGAFQPTNTIVDYYVKSISETSGSFRINFEDVEQGADHDMDAIVRYEYQLLDDSNNTVSNPADAEKLSVNCTSEYAAGGIIQHLGYIISGTTSDGSYLVVRDDDTDASNDVDYFLDTPNNATALPKNDYRVFEPDDNPAAQLMKNPLWYAAKWGGFKDADNDNIPEDTEWDQDGDGDPDTYFYVNNPTQLDSKLNQAFANILKRLSAGSAASVVSGSRSGEGALYQAVFWPSLFDEVAQNELTWVGDVHALLVDSKGDLFEDSNGNKQLDSGDEQVTLYFHEGKERTQACVGGVVTNGTCNATIEELDEVDYLWSAAEWLNDPALDSGITSNRSFFTADSDYRYLFTWFDSDGDGAVDDSSIDDSGEVVNFLGSNAPANATAVWNATVINWVRGQETTGLRSRVYKEGGTDKVWRLGDVIHSTPAVVAEPSENYDLYWGDDTYREFYRKYKNRRIMVYFGGNDGILHAVNGGFYKAEEKKYYTDYNPNADPAFSSDSNDLDLGAEMWGYVPYNLLPHLSCLTDPDYEHHYYVDLHPRAFDVRAWVDDFNDPNAEHPNGWGTILVCGMRFGGPHVEIGGRDFASSYFIFDVTDPESPPELLGEVTYDYDDPDTAELGYSLSVPTVLPTFTTSGDQRWYLALGSGPDAANINQTDAGSSRNATLAFVPLHKLTESNTEFSLRIPDSPPSEDQAGVLRSSQANAFVGSDLVALDYDIDFQSDMLYFGTVRGNQGDWQGGLSRVQVDSASSIDSWTVHPLLDAQKPVTAAPNVGWHDGRIWVYFGTGRYLTRNDASNPSSAQNYFFGLKEPMDNSTGAYTYDTANIDYASFDATDWVRSSDILVRADNGGLECVGGGTSCLSTYSALSSYDFLHLKEYTLNTADYGWFRELDPAERVVGQPSLLGGLVNFSAYSPNDDVCMSEGQSLLYSLYYLTGTAWKENVFGEEDASYVQFTKSLGRGLSITPTMHVGSEEGGKVMVQTSTGEIKTVDQPNLPVQMRSGSTSWHLEDE